MIQKLINDIVGDDFNPERRLFLQRAGIATAALAAATVVPGIAFAQHDSGKYDISYLWHKDLEAVLDYQEQVARVLGPEASAHLHIVKGIKNYGLIYDRDGDYLSTLRVALKHSKDLRSAGLDRAAILQDKGYDSLYNVSFGKGPNLDQLKKDFEIVATVLGKEVKKDLYIEKVDGEYALIYRRRGDRQSTTQVAQIHDELLAKRSIGGRRIHASIIKENNNELVHNMGSLLNEQEQPRPKPMVKPLPLAQPTGSSLEHSIESYIHQLRQQNRLRLDERTAWTVYDFTADEKLVSINEDVPMQAASMAKVYFALAFFHEVQSKRLKYNAEAQRQLERMIQKSSNKAANWVIKQVGGPRAVDKILAEHYGVRFPQTDIVEPIPRGGRTYLNKASAHDYSRFLFDLWNDRLPSSRELKRLMALPGRDRLYTGASAISAGVLVYNKTGSTSHLCGDMGILVPQDVRGNRFPYVIIGIIQNASRVGNYGSWIASRGNIIREVSNVVYEEMKRRHKLI